MPVIFFVVYAILKMINTNGSKFAILKQQRFYKINFQTDYEK